MLVVEVEGAEKWKTLTNRVLDDARKHEAFGKRDPPGVYFQDI